ncbi:unnamed protein product [Phytophthora fragariaefolia]|uniref:Unnamed protein product n=1 Tax=Phytophthora fragariaefolia TaxID=1490495 RepID=A0A9W6XW02_9STRA|nr:unnamed protein product [Phytophthora fragariaefolia]
MWSSQRCCSHRRSETHRLKRSPRQIQDTTTIETGSRYIARESTGDDAVTPPRTGLDVRETARDVAREQAAEARRERGEDRFGGGLGAFDEERESDSERDFDATGVESGRTAAFRLWRVEVSDEAVWPPEPDSEFESSSNGDIQWDIGSNTRIRNDSGDNVIQTLGRLHL